jgi:thiamine biosynthesis protein ThiI
MKNKKRVLLLLSSGIDSPVAGYLASKKGFEVYAVHYTSQDERALQKVKKLAKQTGIKKLFVLNHTIFMKEVVSKCTPRFNCILCKRFMYRIASQIAKENECQYLVDGGNLGQVASQTLDNIVLTAKVSEIDLLRPLLTFEKQDIVNIASEIDTFNISSEKERGCMYVPKFPVTKTRVRFLELEESKLDLSKLIHLTIESSKAITI